jgi:hypothetical protein
MSTEDFYLSALNIEVNAIQALLHGGADTSDVELTWDSTATLKIPVSYARNLFQYQADAIDVNDLNSKDIRFRMFHHVTGVANSENPTALETIRKFYNTKNVIPGEAIVDVGQRIDFYGKVNDVKANETKINADFVRHIAEKVFGVAVTDLFSNERTVRNDLLKKSADNFLANIENLVGFRLNYGTGLDPPDDYVRILTDATTAPAESADNRAKATNFPSRRIFSQLLASRPDRFANLNTFEEAEMRHLFNSDGSSLDLTAEPVAGNGDDLWRKMPLKTGDALYFVLRVNAHADQETLTTVGGVQGTNVASRSYRIKLDIVADEDNAIDTQVDNLENYNRAWDVDGWDSNTKLYYLDDTQNLSGLETGATINNPV